jgi:hypothetical protein
MTVGRLYLAHLSFIFLFPMPYRTLAAASLLLAASLPLVGHAQTTSSRFYVGAGANILSDVPFNSAGVSHLAGPSLTAGLQLTPHVALQAGVSYQWQKETYSEIAYYSAPGNVTTYMSEHRYKYFFIPVLLRYTFTPSAARFHLDALGGVTLLVTTQRDSYETSPATIPQPNVYKSSSFDASLTLGPAIRYSLSPQVELTASSAASMILQNYGRFSNRLFLNTAIGVNYAFGRH